MNANANVAASANVAVGCRAAVVWWGGVGWCGDAICQQNISFNAQGLSYFKICIDTKTRLGRGGG